MDKKIISVSCTGTDIIEVNLLTSIQGRLKYRTREQLNCLRSSILKYGFSFPFFVWKDADIYYTLDGHGRDFVCKELVGEGWQFKQLDGTISTSLPCVFIHAKDKVEAKEKLLALNSSYGEITEEGLLSYIFEPGFELNVSSMTDILMIPGIELGTLNLDIKDEKNEDEKNYKFAFSQEQLKSAIKEHFPQFNSLEEIINRVIDVPLAMHQFNKLCSGNKNVGGEISLLFNPHRLEVKINNRKKTVAEQFLQKDKSLLTSLSQWLSKNAEVVHHNDYIKAAKANTGTQIAHEFKPYLAREIYLDYCKSGDRVLDPCAGWGGRMIGYTASGLAGEYWATDPSTKTFEGLIKLKNFLSLAEQITLPEIKLFNLPFEDLELPTNHFNFAFTSPPYFDTEIYSDEDNQAYARYSTIEQFSINFMTVLIDKTIKALKPDGCFLLNMGGSQYRFDKIIKEICLNLKVRLREVFKYKIGRGDHFTQKLNGDVIENSVKANDLFFEIRR